MHPLSGNTRMRCRPRQCRTIRIVSSVIISIIIHFLEVGTKKGKVHAPPDGDTRLRVLSAMAPKSAARKLPTRWAKVRVSRCSRARCSVTATMAAMSAGSWGRFFLPGDDAAAAAGALLGAAGCVISSGTMMSVTPIQDCQVMDFAVSDQE